MNSRNFAREMKIPTTFPRIARAAAAAALPALLASCFGGEPLGAECDIEAATLAASDTLFYNAADASQQVPSDRNDIVFEVRRTTAAADLTALAPTFGLTPGARIEPASGSVQDFSQGPVHYTVTSEDGQWHRDYTVSVTPVVKETRTEIDYTFLDYELAPDAPYTGKFYVWHNRLADGTLGNDWATGNPGFVLAKSSAKPDEYPTVPVAAEDGGYNGHAALRLTTCDTGGFGKMVGMPLAAGNIFLGEFDVANALKDAMQATRFGKPFTQKPLRLKVVYKYKRGATFCKKEKNNGKWDLVPVPGKLDNGDIYSMLYTNYDPATPDVTHVLHGDDGKTSPRIVALASAGMLESSAEWKELTIEFQYLKPFDYDEAAARHYSLGLVCTPSMEGARFEGAIGSELIIGELKLECAEEE